MIFLYPMLVASDVSPNIIPGICKTLEKFILIYSIDDFLEGARDGLGTKIITIGAAAAGAVTKGAFKLEKENVINLEARDDGTKGYSTPKEKATSGALTGLAQTMTAQASVKMPQFDSLSLEPTYVQAQTNSGSTILGLKVIPFPVKTNTSVASLMNDDSLKTLYHSIVTQYSRKIVRMLYAIIRSFKVPGFRSKILSGNPYTDIFFAGSQFADKTFILLNYLDIQSDEVYKSMYVVNKLQKLSWGSYIIADDVNKRAIFCMKQFKGLCSVVLYQHIYSSLQGTKAYEVFKDLEDVRRSAGPFFRLKTSPKRIMGESYADKKLVEYLHQINSSK